MENVILSNQTTGGVSPELLSTVAGILLSLGFSYIPGLQAWFDGLGRPADGPDDGGTRKRLVMLGLLALTTLGIYGLACTPVGPILELPARCDGPGAIDLAWSFILAVVANQSAYQISPRPGERRFWRSL